MFELLNSAEEVLLEKVEELTVILFVGLFALFTLED